MSAELFSPWDMDVASVNFGAMCGHGALAAALGTDVCRVMQYFDRGGWVNMPIMKAALAKACRPFETVDGWPPLDSNRMGVSMVQWLGPWMQEGVPVAARCQHRHWIAVRGRHVWDCNLGSWASREDWEGEVIHVLMPKRGTGYRIERTYLLT